MLDPDARGEQALLRIPREREYRFWRRAEQILNGDLKVAEQLLVPPHAAVSIDRDEERCSGLVHGDLAQAGLQRRELAPSLGVDAVDGGGTHNGPGFATRRARDFEERALRDAVEIRLLHLEADDDCGRRLAAGVVVGEDCGECEAGLRVGGAGLGELEGEGEGAAAVFDDVAELALARAEEAVLRHLFVIEVDADVGRGVGGRVGGEVEDLREGRVPLVGQGARAPDLDVAPAAAGVDDGYRVEAAVARQF